MWIWEMPNSDGGNVAAIAARARRAAIGTVFVKAADGTHTMAQYSARLVRALHRAGLRACAWQFVYGASPRDEARAAKAAVAAGADCLVIDAEASYEGRYAAAQKYMSALRSAVGADYPLGLTSFPYVDYHPGLPFSVFLAPGGAQVNLPQVYWKAIGGGVDVVSAHALVHNRIYGAPITPIGQTYESPSPAALRRFRSLWAGWGAHGLSWWSWQSTDATRWRVLSEAAPAPAVTPDPGWPTLRSGAKGDEVIWLQQHLSATYPQVRVTGRYDTATGRAVRRLQATGGLKVTGATDGPTWTAALKLPFTATDWTAKSASRARAHASAARRELRRLDAPPARRQQTIVRPSNSSGAVAAGTPRYCGSVGTAAVTAASGSVSCRTARRVVSKARRRPSGNTRVGTWRCAIFSPTSGTCRNARGRINWERNELG